MRQGELMSTARLLSQAALFTLLFVAGQADSSVSASELSALELSQRQFACGAPEHGLCCPEEVCVKERFRQKLQAIQKLQAKRVAGGSGGAEMHLELRQQSKLPKAIGSRRRYVVEKRTMPPMSKESAAIFQTEFLKQGFAVVSGLLNASACEDAALAVYKQLQRDTISIDNLDYLSSNDFRHNLLIDPVKERKSALGQVLHEMLAWLARPLADIVGVGAPAIELSAFVTNPGSAAQDLHRDVVLPKDAEGFAAFVTCFAVLRSPGREAAGGLQIVPRSHAGSSFRSLVDEAVEEWFKCEDLKVERCRGRRDFKNWSVDLSALPAGSVYCYDATAWHRGMSYPNTSSAGTVPRTVINLGFYGPGKIVPGPLFNMFPRSIGKVVLPESIPENEAVAGQNKMERSEL
eukprot:gnl/TRDRNA2_/TRDRNA2_174341_c0_seq3.p1 gnl/TRDRNA2_/TRDRNA2_174341_c0~~gnl/TRDRNA2_/TRDRNA2_174341_c0_seq3.p1  ORF type:complete len:405 (+),score=67.50 gnl/TRDRNA2_/TRDRNA2_174341_c0_seq3:169-1383(+)